MIWPFEQAEQSDGRGKYDGQRKRKGADALAALLNRFCFDDYPADNYLIIAFTLQVSAMRVRHREWNDHLRFI
jgi:hypothetical protein